MMQVLLDGHPVRSQRESLAAAFSAGVEAAQAKGRIIVEVRFDGEPVSHETLASITDGPTTVREVRFTSAHPADTVREAFADVGATLDAIRANQTAAGEHLQAGRLDASLPHIDAAVKAWQVVRDTLVQGSALAGLDLGSLAHPDSTSTIDQAATDLARHLRAINDSLRKKDLVETADLLLYDLNEQAQHWRTMLEGVSSALPRGAEP